MTPFTASSSSRSCGTWWGRARPQPVWPRTMSDMSDPNDGAAGGPRFDAGMRVRRAVLGDEHVDRALASQTAFDAPFQQFITEVAWGSLWARDGLDVRTRSLITIALLAALGRREELEVHVRATR